MRLFEINPDDSTVNLNKEWIMLIPEFAVLFARDKGSDGDYRGSKKLKTRKELTFIYFYTDFASPITDWEDIEREKEAMYYANLTEIDDKVWAAQKKYDELQHKGSRSLRTYRAMLKSSSAMDTYLENLDFSLKSTRTGELLNSPDKVAKTISDMDKMHTAIANFRKRVEQELKDQSTGIRGTAELGYLEEKQVTFSETDVMAGSAHSAEGVPASTGTFNKMLDMLKDQAKTAVPVKEDELKSANIGDIFERGDEQ